MKKILTSLSIIGLVAAMAISATMSYFNDTETSTGNTFTAGSIDLKIDLQCPGGGCNFSLRDLNGESFFHEYDIKPGDTGEVTISWHVTSNDAWGRIRLADLIDYENDCNEPEGDVDTSCGDPGLGEGELDDYLEFTFWMDEGEIAGWDCPYNENGPCNDDLLERDNVLNGVEEIIGGESLSASEIIAQGGVELPEVLESGTTYYLGMQWEVLPETGNIIQTDSLIGKIIMEVVQTRNNPNPWQ